MPALLVICGPPCAGKSMLAQGLRDELAWPLLAKDAIKESLFETLGTGDRAWSKRLSLASYRLMFGVARELCGAESPCMLEGNFRWQETAAHFEALARIPNIEFIQIFCTAPVAVLVERFRARAASGTRHPGHVDLDSHEEIEAEMKSAAMQPLPLPGLTLTVDSTRDQPRELAEWVKEIRGRSSC